MKLVLTALLVLVLAAGGGLGVWYWQSQHGPRNTFRTAAVERGDLLATISATGTTEPEEVIDVGAQVAGRIEKFGRDPNDSRKAIDYGTEVEEGTVLAQLDDSLYRAKVEQCKANLARAEADLKQLEAKHVQAEHDWQRARALLARGAGTQADYDLALATYDSARAAVGVGKATIEQMKAALAEAETNLGYTTIRSPVKGVIVDRRVNVGQTVVASLNAPSLFLIAKDLKRMQVWASVNEADVGNIRRGQPVRFTVDAYPGEVFTGEVAQVRLNASMTNNVVTYTVVVSTDNSSGKLLPYLTANMQFEVSRRNNVLLVPNAALRWRPKPQQVAPDAREDFLKAQRRKNEKGNSLERHDRATVWV